MSFHEYLNSLRFEHALLLLKKTDLNKRLKSVYGLSIKEFKNADLNLNRGAADKWEEQLIYSPKEGLEIMRRHHHFDCDKKLGK